MIHRYPISFKIHVIVVLLSFTMIVTSMAQPCNQQNISLFTQDQVDNFKNYNCTVIEGQLYLNGMGITNVDSLEEIVEIGELLINSTGIVDFEGFSSLKKVHGEANISFNPSLTTMNGLDALEEVNSLFISNNNVLASLEGLNNVRTIPDRVYISRNPALLSLYGLNGLDSVRNEITIDENAMLQNLTGLDNLISAGSIRIEGNASLYSINGLGNLTTVRDGLVVFLNLGLTEVGNLENLVHVGKKLWFSYNPQLKSLEGLKVQTITGGDKEGFFDGFVVTNSKIKDLKGLENLEVVEGWFYIGNNVELTTLDGLDNLRYIDGHFGIEDNITLRSIEAIADLEFISGELELSDNDSLQLCSIESICSYLAAPAGLVLIWGNGPGCTSDVDILSNCSPVIDFHIVDANLDVDTSAMTTGDIRELSTTALLNLDQMRAGVATDGVSPVLFRLTTGTKGNMSIANAEENGIEFPWGDTTHFLNGRNYFFFLFTPPDEFDELEEIYMFEDAVEAYDTEIEYTFTSDSDVRQNNLTITHVRPPVVLMHGTYSSPDKAWKTATAEGISMYDRLVQEGFNVFTVNYEKTNGTTGIFADNTSFADNSKVLWGDVYPENTGGIKDALTHYRENLNVAATQADVIGHSLGGVLPRVYASPNFYPDYKRPENLMEGDINRLITIGSTHFGSDLGDLHIWLDGLSPFNIGLLDWLVVETVNTIADVVGGASPSEAVIDQRPLPTGTALSYIGRTEIPSHAITLSVPKGGLKDTLVDPDESYYDLYWYLTTLMYQVNDVRTEYLDSKLELADMGLQANSTITGGNPADLYPYYTRYMLYKSMIEDALHRAGTLASVLDGTFELPSDIEIFKYAFGEAGMGDLADPLLDVFVAGADPVGVALDYFFPDIQFPTVQSIIEDQLRVNKETMEALRSLIFNNDRNDGVVRVQSQSGELEKECPDCVTHFDNVLHGFAPRYPAVQDHLVQLLRSDMIAFNEAGFPPVDHPQQIYYPPESLDLFKVPISNGAAICQSGMVPSHARAFAHIADQNNVIILSRPVNPDGTRHIANHAATKGMDVKPKSSNWGPQKGFIPVQQRYSKLWRIFEGPKRDEKIAEYDQLAQENLNQGVAVSRELVVDICDDLFKIYIDQNKIGGPGDMNAEDEVVMVPLSDPTKVCYWGEDFLFNEIIDHCEPLGPEHQLVPFPVLASPIQFEDDGVTPRFFTADYDLLMVGFFKGQDQGRPMPPDLPFEPGFGQITEEQKQLLTELNVAVKNTGYRGGNVVHHGPENQFSKSPYIDYPVTVFAPDNIPNGLFNYATDGLILSIEMGPPGFRDLNLKQFVNRMRKEGYDLYDNPAAPGWKWIWNDDAEAYQLEDSKDLPDYVEQLPKNACDKFGGQVKDACPVAPNGDAASNDRPGSFVKGNIDATGDIIFRFAPTIVYDQPVTFTIDTDKKQSFTWMILDPFGNVFERGTITEGQTHVEISIDVSNLGSGVYTVVTDMYGGAGRFVKF